MLIDNSSLLIAYAVFGFLLDYSSISLLMAGRGVCIAGVCIFMFVRLPIQPEAEMDVRPEVR